jgi:hypothetical protein
MPSIVISKNNLFINPTTQRTANSEIRSPPTAQAGGRLLAKTESAKNVAKRTGNWHVAKYP